MNKKEQFPGPWMDIGERINTPHVPSLSVHKSGLGQSDLILSPGPIKSFVLRHLPITRRDSWH